MERQVDKSHYEFARYLHKRRWVSMWHQLDEVLKFHPKNVLEIGPGPGIFKATAGALGLHVETLDLDPNLNPDHVASVFDMPFKNGAFDVVCAFQMLEHLPFEDSRRAFREMARVARTAIVISLPDAATRWPISVYLPVIGMVHLLVPRPRLRAPVHEFDGEHYWEINKSKYSLKTVCAELFGLDSIYIKSTYRVPEHPYHRFFVLKKVSSS